MAETKKTTKTAATKKTTKKAVKKAVAEAPAAPQHIGIVNRDPWLEPYENAIRGRHDHAMWMADHLTNGGKQKLADFATGYLHDIGDPADYPHTRWKGIVSWLLFRNKDKWQSS